MATRYCLRCPDAQLTPMAGATDAMAFFECPSCERRYARRAGGDLMFRWPHPVAMPLYSVLFEDDPVSRAGDVARRFARQRTDDELFQMIAEIERELADPTQEIRAILDNPQAEHVCRAYLREFVDRLRTELS